MFISKEFKQFLAQNGIYHITSAPYHPSTNALAERPVQTFKNAMKKSGSSNLEYNLSKFLFQYRITPHATTGETPSKILMGRQLRSQLNLVHPNLQQHVEDAQNRQKENHDVRARERQFVSGDSVYSRAYSGGNSWLSGRVLGRTGPVSATVQLTGGSVERRHNDQLQHRQESDPVTDIVPAAEKDTLPAAQVREEAIVPAAETDTVPVVQRREEVTETVKHYPIRDRKPPGHLKDFKIRKT